jgi:hypothetical protein
MEEWAARSGAEPLPPDPAPRKLRIQPHASEAVSDDLDDDGDADDEDIESYGHSDDDDWEDEDPEAS